ncbi:hypothetical protein ACO0SA_002251 [Hanseniaspora valbyensis]
MDGSVTNRNSTPSPRELLFNDIFNNERKATTTDSIDRTFVPTNDSLTFYNIVSDNENFLRDTLAKLKGTVENIDSVYNKDDIEKQSYVETTPSSFENISPTVAETITNTPPDQRLFTPPLRPAALINASNDNTDKQKLVVNKTKKNITVDTQLANNFDNNNNNNNNSSSFNTPARNKQHQKVLSTTSRISSASSNFSQQQQQLIPGTPQSSYSNNSRKLYVNNPQLFSKVAIRLNKLIQPTSNYHPKQMDLLIHNSFFGGHCVDILCKILRTNDRTLATLYGRSLQQQGVIKDCLNKQKLRDNNSELYCIDQAALAEVNGVCVLLSKCYSPTCTRDKPCYSLSCPRRRTLKKQTSMKTLNKNKSMSNLASRLSSNAFNTERRKSSSAAATPLSSKPSMNFNSNIPTPTTANGHNNTNSSIINNSNNNNTGSGNIIIQNINQNYLNSASNDEKTLWSSSVPMEILEKLSSKEIKRQEAIYEVYVTEKNFVKSLETVRDSIIKTLAETNIIPHDIRKNFIKHVFAHVNDIYSVNKRFLDSLNDRMHPQNYIISGIGDIILKWIPFFEPFVFYIASRPYAKYLMETQRQVNPYFSRFDEDLMNSKLRHGIDSFLSQGVSRPGRYVLLVREILKKFDCLTKSLELLNALMKRIDKASGAAQDRHDVILLKQKILFKNEFVNLGLNDEKRRIRHEGTLFRKEINTISNAGQLSNQMSSSNLSGLNSNSVNVAQNFNMNNVGDIQFYLLDNVLLFLKSKAVNKWNQHKVFQRPIPLPLLFVIPGEEMSVSLRKYIGSKLGFSGCVLDAAELNQLNSSKPYNNKNDVFNYNSGMANNIIQKEDDDNSDSLLKKRSVSANNNGSITNLNTAHAHKRNSSSITSLKEMTASSSLTSLSQSSKKLSLINSSVNSNAITFLYYGAKQRYQITLYGAQIAAITTLLDKIKQEQNRLIQNYNIFTLYKLSDKVFDYNNRILSLEPFDYGKKNLVLTNQGLSMCTLIEKPSANKDKQFVLSPPLRLVTNLNNSNNKIQQIAVLEELQILLVLIDKKLYWVKLMILNDIIGQPNPFQFLKKYCRELLTHVVFFKVGKCANKDLVVTTQSSGSMIKFFELTNLVKSIQEANNHQQSAGSANDTKRKQAKLKITSVSFDSDPISISFLKNNLCVGCKKGFQIVSVTQNAHEPLLDPADTSLEFAIKQMHNNGYGTTTIVLDNGSVSTSNYSNSGLSFGGMLGDSSGGDHAHAHGGSGVGVGVSVVGGGTSAISTSSNSNNGFLKPMDIYRIGNNFLLNYQELSFFVNSQGWRKKDSNIIYWEGIPLGFCLYYPYVLAFNTNFIEIRYVETGELIRCIIAEKIRLLKPNKDFNTELNNKNENPNIKIGKEDNNSINNDDEILYAYEDDRGYDVIASIKFT